MFDLEFAHEPFVAPTDDLARFDAVERMQGRP
jgi:hypothetical protein